MPRRVMFATDFPIRNPDLVGAAMQFAAAVRAPGVTIIHVLSKDELQQLTEGRPEESRYTDVALSEIASDIRHQLKEIVADSDMPFDVAVALGDPGGVILERAKAEDVGYIVVGVRNRSRVGKLLFGSTTQSVLLQADRPVLAIPLAPDLAPA